jgi:hypothetical protein
VSVKNVGLSSKFVIIIVAMVGLFGALATGNATWEQIDVYLSAIIFYSIGNGVQAMNGKGTVGVFTPKIKEQ